MSYNSFTYTPEDVDAIEALGVKVYGGSPDSLLIGTGNEEIVISYFENKRAACRMETQTEKNSK